MRKAAIITAIAGIAVVLAIVIVPSFLDVNRYHALVQSELQKALGRPVSFGKMHLSLTPPKLVLESVVVVEDPAFGTGLFASIPKLDAILRIAPLWHGEVELAALGFQNPRLQLMRNARGVWNFSTLGQPAPPAPAAQAGKAREGGGVSISNLRITGGEVTLIDAQKNFRGVYRNIDLSVSGFAPGKSFDVRIAAKLPGPGAETVQLAGVAGPLTQNDLVNTPFDGQLKADEVSLSGLQKVLDTQALAGMDAVVSGTMKVRNQNGVLTSSGSLKLVDTKVRGVAIGYPITADYQLNDDFNAGSIRIDKGTISLGPTPLSLTGEVNTAATPARLNLAITTRDASIAEAARLAAAFGVAFNAGMNVSGRLNADVRATGAAGHPLLSGTVSAVNLAVSGGGLQQPVQVREMRLALSPTAIQSNEFTASSGGTSLTGKFTLTNYSTPSPGIQGTLRTANASVAELLGIARAYGVSAAEGITGTGTLTLELSAAGLLNNASTLNFSGSGALANVSLKTASLTQPLNLQRANLQFSKNSLTLENLAASLAGSNAGGTITLRNFAAPDVQFSLTADKVNVIQLQQALGGSPQPVRAATGQGLGIIPAAWAQSAPAGRNTAPPGGPLANLTGRGTIGVGALIYDQLVLNGVKAEVTLDHGIVRFTPTSASIYGGQQSSTIVVDTRTTPLAIQINGKLSNVDANALLSSISPLKQTLYGLLSASANTSFRAASSADIARTLNGTLSMDLSKGRLAHVNLMSQLANLGRFVSAPAGQAGAQAQPFTDLVQLAGNFNVTNGVAQTNDLKAVIPGGSLAAVGLVDLGTQALNLRVTAVLDKALSQQVGGTQIGGFMQTALANKQGELVIPILVGGTLDKPSFAPDVQKIAQMKLQQMLPTSSNPAGMTSGILGTILGQRGGSQQGGANPPAQGGLGGILGAIAGQQQQPAQQQTAPQEKPAANGQAQPPPQQSPMQQLLDIFGGKKKTQQPSQPPPPQAPPK